MGLRQHLDLGIRKCPNKTPFLETVWEFLPQPLQQAASGPFEGVEARELSP